MHLAVEVQVQINCYIIIVDVEHHVDVVTNLDVEDLDIVDPLIMGGVTVVENLCLEVGGDHQFVVEDNLLLP